MSQRYVWGKYNADAFITAEEAAALLESMVEKATAGSKLVEITIPAESWALDESLAPDLEMPGTMPIYPYYADVTGPEAQASYFPAAALHTDRIQRERRRAKQQRCITAKRQRSLARQAAYRSPDLPPWE